MAHTLMAKRRKMRMVECYTCHKNIKKKPSRIGNKTFCSKQCMKVQRFEIICKKCGKPFFVTPFYKEKRKYCSWICSPVGKIKYGFAHDGVKRCTSCGLEKSITDFRPNIRTKDGLMTNCERCVKDKRIKKEYNVSLDYIEGKPCEICGSYKKICLDHDHALKIPRGPLCHKCNSGLGMFQDDLESLKNAVIYLQRFRPEYEYFYNEKSGKYKFVPMDPSQWEIPHDL